MIGTQQFSQIKEYLDNEKDLNISLFVFENRKTKTNPYKVYKLVIDKDLSNELIRIARSFWDKVSETMKSEEISEFPDYNPDLDSQNFFRIGTDDVELYNAILPKLNGQDEVETFCIKNMKEDKIKGWIAKIQFEFDNVSSDIYLFQKFQKSKMIAKNRFFFFEENDGFKLFNKNILAMNDGFDFSVFENTFVVINKYAFEKMFEFEKFYKSRAIELINNIARNAKMANADVSFKVTDTDKLRMKIENSKRLSHQYFKASNSNYYKSIKYSYLKEVDEKYEFGLILDDIEKKWTINDNTDLKIAGNILNDDYQKSQLTTNEYISRGKEKIS